MNKRRKDLSGMAASRSRIRHVILPDEMMFEILIRLPVPPLLRFKSVCTSWRTSIESSDFVSRHLHQSKLENNKENKVIVFSPHKWGRRYFSFTFSIISISDLQVYKSVEFIPIHNSKNWSREKLIASFDGLICFKYEILECPNICLEVDPNVCAEVVSLWNPTTNHITILPSLPRHMVEGTHCRMDYGFGFDVKTNDYKVVRIQNSLKDGMTKNYVEVYSLRMNSWRTIKAVVRVSIYSDPRKPFRNDIYLWWGFAWDSGKPVILSFSFSDEVFGTIPFPELPTYYFKRTLSLAFLREKLALIREDANNSFKIWVMNEYGVKESWTCLYTLVLNGLERPKGFTSDGKIILIREGLEQLCFYDPVTQEISDIPFVGVVSDAVVYNETLVSARSANGATGSASSEALRSVCSMYPNRVKPLSKNVDV